MYIFIECNRELEIYFSLKDHYDGFKHLITKCKDEFIDVLIVFV